MLTGVTQHMKATTEQAEQQSKALAKLLRDLDDQEKRRTESISALASSLLALGAARPAGRHGDVRWSRAKAHADTVWAPLADTMTLLASVFFVVMIAMFIASERSKALQLKAESQIGDVQRQKGAKLERAEALIEQAEGAQARRFGRHCRERRGPAARHRAVWNQQR